jgi:hypothetical protein
MIAREVSPFPRKKFSPAHTASASRMLSVVSDVFEGVYRG